MSYSNSNGIASMPGWVVVGVRVRALSQNADRLSSSEATIRAVDAARGLVILGDAAGPLAAVPCVYRWSDLWPCDMIGTPLSVTGEGAISQPAPISATR